MNEYIYYTTEGETIAPDEDVEVDNCQVLGRIKARNAEQAMQLLLQENPWIEEAGFDTADIIVEQLLTEEQKADIKGRSLKLPWRQRPSSTRISCKHDRGRRGYRTYHAVAP